MAPDRLPDDPRPSASSSSPSWRARSPVSRSRRCRRARRAGIRMPPRRPSADALTQLPSLGELYVSMLTHGAAAFAELARLVADRRGLRRRAVLVHCTAGKDRTGVAIALLLDAVGADRDAIVADYAASEANLSGAWADGMFAMIERDGRAAHPDARRAHRAPPRPRRSRRHSRGSSASTAARRPTCARAASPRPSCPRCAGV